VVVYQTKNQKSKSIFTFQVRSQDLVEFVCERDLSPSLKSVTEFTLRVVWLGTALGGSITVNIKGWAFLFLFFNKHTGVGGLSISEVGRFFRTKRKVRSIKKK